MRLKRCSFDGVAHERSNVFLQNCNETNHDVDDCSYHSAFFQNLYYQWSSELLFSFLAKSTCHVFDIRAYFFLTKCQECFLGTLPIFSEKIPAKNFFTRCIFRLKRILVFVRVDKLSVCQQEKRKKTFEKNALYLCIRKNSPPKRCQLLGYEKVYKDMGV